MPFQVKDKVVVKQTDEVGVVELVDSNSPQTDGVIYHVRLRNDEVRNYKEEELETAEG